MHKYRMTFWPRFAISRNDLGNWVKVKDMFTLRPAPSTEFRGGSCCGSQIGWGPHICKVLPGCIITHSKTPINIHVTVLHSGLGTGVGWGWGWGGDGDWGWGIGNVRYFPLISVNFHYFPLFSVNFH